MAEQENQTEAVVKKTRGRKAAVVAEAAVPVGEPVVDMAPVAAKKPRATRAKAAEAGADKPVAKPRKSASAKSAKEKVSAEERYQMVAMAAYFIAERRGFLTGYEHDDWLLAEQEIDARFEVI
jgi:hypothetical protein